MLGLEIGGRAITPGVVVLALVIGWIAFRTFRRRPRTVGGLVSLIVFVHVIAAVTSLDMARIGDFRRFVVRGAIEAFFLAAGVLDTVFAAVWRAIGWLFDTLASISMPGTAVSVLDFAAFLVAVLVVSALVWGALVLIARSTAGAPLGAWLAALGVLFGALGVVLTWLPVAPGEMTAIQVVLVVLAAGGGYPISAVATGTSPTTAVRERIRT